MSDTKPVDPGSCDLAATALMMSESALSLSARERDIKLIQGYFFALEHAAAKGYYPSLNEMRKHLGVGD